MGEGIFGNLTVNCLLPFCSVEIQDDLSLLDESYSSFHVEFGISSEFDFCDFIHRDDLPLCDATDYSLPLPTIGIQFSKAIARTCDIISPYEQICDSMFVMTQRNKRDRVCHMNGD
jgi:hypothetical protein